MLFGDDVSQAPLAYKVRVSSRAKRLQLKVAPPGRIEVVVPKRVSVNRVPAFVAEHEAWLRQTLYRMAEQYPGEPSLPEQIEFPALGEQWQVVTRPAARGRLTMAGDRLELQMTDETAGRRMLQRWLAQHAKRHLLPWLAGVSAEVGLAYEGATIRAQRTRWGSCSARRHISLNRSLLFLPPATVRYLLIHELCHTVHMNHSPRYWRLVASLMPDYRQHEKVLRNQGHAIPRWSLPE